MRYAIYEIKYKIHNQSPEGTSDEERATLAPITTRVSASNLQRAINKVANVLKERGDIESRNDVVFLEGRVTV